MFAVPVALDVPLHTDPDGTIRVGNSRITLLVLLGAYQRGDTPEEIAEAFDTVQLEEVYAVIAWYLHHRAEVDTYIQRVEREAAEARQHFEAAYPPKPLTREMLQARLEEKRKRGDS